MNDLYWLTNEQMERLRPSFPRSDGRPRVDDRRVLNGIIFVNRNGLRWRDAPKDYGPVRTLYNRWKRWSETGVFVRMMEGLVAVGADPRTLVIDAAYLKAHRTASSLPVKKGVSVAGSAVPEGGMNARLHAVADANSRPRSFFLTVARVGE